MPVTPVWFGSHAPACPSCAYRRCHPPMRWRRTEFAVSLRTPCGPGTLATTPARTLRPALPIGYVPRLVVEGGHVRPGVERIRASRYDLPVDQRDRHGLVDDPIVHLDPELTRFRGVQFVLRLVVEIVERLVDPPGAGDPGPVVLLLRDIFGGVARVPPGHVRARERRAEPRGKHLDIGVKVSPRIVVARRTGEEHAG